MANINAEPSQNRRANLSAFWSLPIDVLLESLDTSPQGISPAEASTRLGLYGKNSLKTKKQATVIGLFFNQIKSPIMLILLFATLVSAFLSDWVDAVIILLIILGSAVLSVVQEYSANHATEKLQSQVSAKATVSRGGQQQAIPVEEIVPGDLVLLNAGSMVPADGVILEAKDFFVNQAVLTGETFPVEKIPGPVAANTSVNARSNSVFMGTNVRSGSAQELVVQTGVHTAFGQIAGRLNLRPPETEFERGIKVLGYLLTEVMFILVIAIFALNVYFHKPVIDSLLFSIALAVGLTPQLLPAIININLSKGAQAMATQGVIVRRLEAIENFGSMDTLCTDKTGTITAGVVQLDEAVDVSGSPSDQVLKDAYINANFQTGLSNPLDNAILAKDRVDITGIEKVDECPYDFVRKRLSVVVSGSNVTGPDQNKLITKGALEKILEVCTSVQAEGRTVPLDTEQRTVIEKQYADWSSQGYRVLGLASKEMAKQTVPYKPEDEHELTFGGFLLFLDPPKPGVEATVKELKQAGVTLKIITGDNRLVAEHIAKSIGFDETDVVTSSEMDQMDDTALLRAVDWAEIFAEVDPNQKERIILALKKGGHVVGYMGDGINDAPPLHAADVGVSVDNAVDVAKEAADFVLMKQDLEVLLNGILQGRRTFANTLKYVFMATSANFGNMFSMAGASLFLPFLPMLPKQVLLINFMTDLPEMAIAGDRVDDEFVTRPHRWDVNFIRRFMLVFGPLSSVFDYLTFALLSWVLRAGELEFHTGWFVESILSASVVVFALRTRLPFYKSRPSPTMLLATGFVIMVTLALPYSPLAGVLALTPLPVPFLLAVFAIVGFYFLAAEFAKRWFFKRFWK